MLISIHSLTDLITNSSTVIFTRHNKSPGVLRDLVNEILNLMGVKKLRCKDIFDISIKPAAAPNPNEIYWWFEDEPDFANSYHTDRFEQFDIPKEYMLVPELNEKSNDIAKAKIAALYYGVINGTIEAPEWYRMLLHQMQTRSRNENEILDIKVKNPKYKKLAKHLINYICSVESVEVSK